MNVRLNQSEIDEAVQQWLEKRNLKPRGDAKVFYSMNPPVNGVLTASIEIEPIEISAGPYR